MAKRPPGVDPEAWRTQRAEVWRRRNIVLNGLMIAVIVAVLVRWYLNG